MLPYVETLRHLIVANLKTSRSSQTPDESETSSPKPPPRPLPSSFPTPPFALVPFQSQHYSTVLQRTPIILPPLSPLLLLFHSPQSRVVHTGLRVSAHVRLDISPPHAHPDPASPRACPPLFRSLPSPLSRILPTPPSPFFGCLPALPPPLLQSAFLEFDAELSW